MLVSQVSSGLDSFTICTKMMMHQERKGFSYLFESKVGFTENTAMRHRRGGFSEVTVTSRLTDR